MKATIAILMKIARQVEGEQIFVSVIEANEDVTAIRNYLNTTTLPRTEKIQGIDCVLEYGVITDIEVDISEKGA